MVDIFSLINCYVLIMLSFYLYWIVKKCPKSKKLWHLALATPFLTFFVFAPVMWIFKIILLYPILDQIGVILIIWMFLACLSQLAYFEEKQPEPESPYNLLNYYIAVILMLIVVIFKNLISAYISLIGYSIWASAWLIYHVFRARD